ncbi:prephenate dehydratase [Flavobacteriaceae bacterium]|jgi:prephenate dehydratase|nr:prephenate dehydratase [Flavobacteriaceae bacterium]MDA8643936.1 prephenate dehydratase [Flavobacteriaceae bacterium]MDA8877334.1 prephenate dehydratase [Flavobacteriaceae bacterium]MDC0871982.1 prephenate dehydratase [Flavobacteriaceae bacterium]MDC3241094.1 prephenate dehydratase [Flavobacteriaceae bacterium]
MKAKTKVAIQGKQGSFHHIVAQRYFGAQLDLLPCDTFDDTIQTLVDGESEQAVLAIENSIAGSIIPNYALIDQNDLKIVGEYGLSIHHNLMGLSGQTIKDLKEVHSHPMALLQCKNFFQQHPHIRLVEAEDTAEEAQRISKNQIKGIGAIASQEAAELYQLTVFATSIQTIKNNVTRFVIVQRKGDLVSKSQINKAALKFTLDHQRGSLAAVLNVMSDCQLNLTKIQSLPVIETPGKYAFFVDVTFDDFTHYEKARKLIAIMASKFKILGEYAQHQR